MEEILHGGSSMSSVLLDRITDIFIAFDTDWQVMYLNKNAAKLLGKSRGEFLGENIWESCPHLQLGQLQSFCKEALSTQCTLHREFFSPSLKRWLKGSFYPDSHGLSVYLRDISEYKEYERRLQFLAALQQNISDVVIATDEKLHIRSWNKAAEKLYGYLEKEVLDKSITEVLQTRFVMSARKDVFRYARQNGIWKGEMHHVTRDGRVLLIHGSIAPIWNSRGEVEGYVGVNRDITREKEMEMSLQKANSRFNYAAEAVNALIYEWDYKANSVYRSQSIMHLLGYSQDEIEPKSEWWVSLIHPRDRMMFAHAQTAVFKDKEKNRYSLEYRVRHKKGHYIYVWDHGIVERDRKGSPQRIVGSAIDITERQILEETLRQSQQNFKLLTEAIPQIVWTALPDGSIDFLNDKWYEYTGKAERNALSWGWLEKVYPEDREVVERTWKKAVRKKETCSIEFRILHKDNQPRWYLLRAIPMFSARGKSRNVDKWFGTMTDIHVQKAAESHAKANESRFRTLAENAPDIITRHDTSFRYLYVNPAIEDAFGIHAQDFLGKTCEDVAIPEEVCDVFHKRLSYVYKTKRATSAEYQYEIPLGEKYFQSRFVPEFSEDGKLVSVLVISREITDLKRLEKRKDEFMSMASHELKTPLTSAKVFTTLLDHAVGNDEKATLYLSRVNEQIDRLTRLVSDLLDVSKVQAGKLKLQKEYFSLQQLIQETADVMETTNNHHRIEVRGEVGKTVFADRDRINQVIVNLLTNAIKYSPSADRVEVKMQNGGSHVMVAVKDYGLGIPKAHHKKIFDQFYRDEGMNDRTFPGLGIGLYISHEIIRRHGGQIWVESKKGIGSTFYFKLPVSSRE